MVSDDGPGACRTVAIGRRPKPFTKAELGPAWHSSLRQQPPAQIVHFEQVAETANGRLVGHRLVAEIDPHKTRYRYRTGPMRARPSSPRSPAVACNAASSTRLSTFKPRSIGTSANTTANSSRLDRRSQPHHRESQSRVASNGVPLV